jgi:hypothetical protein
MSLGRMRARAEIALKLWAVSILELFRGGAFYRQVQQQRPTIAMASVYKTLSGADTHEKETGEKRNKQRVLILVPIAAQKIEASIQTNTW